MLLVTSRLVPASVIDVFRTNERRACATTFGGVRSEIDKWCSAAAAMSLCLWSRGQACEGVGAGGKERAPHALDYADTELKEYARLDQCIKW